jgi:ribose-phosphate pyrophosphokinase
VHGEEDKRLIPLPIESLSPAKTFGKRLAGLALTDVCFVSPDQGAISRCQALKSASGIVCGDVVYFEKHRSTTGIVHHSPRVERCAVIVDDILDTGATLVSACEKLVAAGAEELYICVTHGLFAGKQWHRLWSLPVRHIFCTDTIPACAVIQDPRITALCIGPMLREKLGRTQSSIGATF